MSYKAYACRTSSLKPHFTDVAIRQRTSTYGKASALRLKLTKSVSQPTNMVIGSRVRFSQIKRGASVHMNQF